MSSDHNQSDCMFSNHNQSRCRLVHRLDRDTSGAIILARTLDASSWLSSAFRQPAQDMGRSTKDLQTPGKL